MSYFNGGRGNLQVVASFGWLERGRRLGLLVVCSTLPGGIPKCQREIVSEAGFFNSLVIPACAGIYIVLQLESCHRPWWCGFPVSRERLDPCSPTWKMKSPGQWGRSV